MKMDSTKISQKIAEMGAVVQYHMPEKGTVEILVISSDLNKCLLSKAATLAKALRIVSWHCGEYNQVIMIRNTKEALFLTLKKGTE